MELVLVHKSILFGIIFDDVSKKYYYVTLFKAHFYYKC